MANIIPLLHIPFVHNGDICTHEDFKHTALLLPTVTTWMIGRGLLYNPFLAEEIKGIRNETNRMKRLKNFLDDLYFGYRNDLNDRLTLLNLLKEYWDYLEHLFADPQQVKRTIKKARSFEEYEDAVNSLF
jgi:tRNA-dihydrouridine synthase